MPDPRFLQIHTLSPYTAALLNRDDSGLAKRLPFGGVMRTRVSSQCLKRHWRMADDPLAIERIDGSAGAHRSRELVTKLVIDKLRESVPEADLKLIDEAFQKAVYGDKGTSKASRQTLLLGAPEIAWLKTQAEALAKPGDGDNRPLNDRLAAWAKELKANAKAMRASASLPGGLAGALFGRLVTSDPDANITAPVHVAHAFTVHAEETESDYFTAVDDLADPEDTGADTIQETELTSGLFYGYVVVDIGGLVDNLGADIALAGAVLNSLVHLIAEVSPGAKLGSTAPYGRASFMLLEAGDRQPRSLAEAYRAPVNPQVDAAVARLGEHLGRVDACYATGEARRVMSLTPVEIPGATGGSLSELAAWAAALPGKGRTAVS
ncbi:MAG: type I-E CRISPR-associated protein Cas7/Cse4/CasC [Rhodobiaceae bacterium]|nr:type I-E CRISPR-associated protein Cas7/Cse4/CasC [Paracoccaceae bacterium]MCB1474095.1 type I-E CRISPR-associated protein Cas7/Cse4/CasC [Rhodobiaceae bacterium]